MKIFWSWTRRRLCTDCSQKEAVCCQSKDELADLLDNELCITSTDLFNGLLSEGLEYSRFIHASAIRDAKKRQEYLSKEVTNGLKRHMLYRNFVLVMSRGYPLGKNKRVVYYLDVSWKRYVKNIQSRRKTVTLALLKRFQSRKMNRLG